MLMGVVVAVAVDVEAHGVIDQVGAVVHDGQHVAVEARDGCGAVEQRRGLNFAAAGGYLDMKRSQIVSPVGTSPDRRADVIPGCVSPGRFFQRRSGWVLLRSPVAGNALGAGSGARMRHANVSP